MAHFKIGISGLPEFYHVADMCGNPRTHDSLVYFFGGREGKVFSGGHVADEIRTKRRRDRRTDGRNLFHLNCDDAASGISKNTHAYLVSQKNRSRLVFGFSHEILVVYQTSKVASRPLVLTQVECT